MKRVQDDGGHHQNDEREEQRPGAFLGPPTLRSPQANARGTSSGRGEVRGTTDLYQVVLRFKVDDNSPPGELTGHPAQEASQHLVLRRVMLEYEIRRAPEMSVQRALADTFVYLGRVRDRRTDPAPSNMPVTPANDVTWPDHEIPTWRTTRRDR